MNPRLEAALQELADAISEAAIAYLDMEPLEVLDQLNIEDEVRDRINNQGEPK